MVAIADILSYLLGNYKECPIYFDDLVVYVLLQSHGSTKDLTQQDLLQILLI
jgi:hypothetical protein